MSTSVSVLSKIKGQGYWCVEFQPLVIDDKRINPLPKCHEVIKKAWIQLRGWDYPHWPDSNSDKHAIYNCNSYIESWTNFGRYKEVWRMYQNAQFVHFFAMKEDYDNDGIFSPSIPPVISRTSLYVISTIYKFTEIYEFLKRLAQQGIYKEGVRVLISLHNAKDRKLILEDPRRMGLSIDYKTVNSEIKFDNIYIAKDILEKSEHFAFTQIIETFHRFNWSNPPEMTIKDDQNKLLTRKI